MTLGAAAGAAVGVVQSPTIPGVGQSPIAFVISSAQNTLSQRTADITFQGIIREKGKSLPLNGTGQADFTRNAFAGSVQFLQGGDTVVENELGVGNRFYLAVVVDGINTSQALAGKHWIQEPVPTGGTGGGIGFGNVDPLTQLKAAEQKGTKVVFVGTTMIDGDTVSGYSLKPSAQEEQRNIQSEVASGQIPASFAATAEQELKVLGTPTSYVYLDAAGLMRRQSVVLSGGTSGVNGRVDVTFTNFGAPISIAVPAASDILSFSAFLKDASQLSNSQ